MNLLQNTLGLLSNKKVIAIFLLILALIGYKYGCYRLPLATIRPLEAIPLNSPLIFQTQSAPTTLSRWRTSPYAAEWQGIQFVYKWVADVEMYNTVFQKTNSFKEIINRSSLTAGAQWAGNNSFEWLFVLSDYPDKIAIDKIIAELSDYKPSPTVFRGTNVYTLQLNDRDKIAIAQHQRLLILAHKTNLVENALEQIDNINSNVTFSPQFKAAQLSLKDSLINVYINFKDLPILLNTLSPQISPQIDLLSQQMSWWGGRIELEGDKIVSKANLFPSTNAIFWQTLSRQNPALSPTLCKLLPDNTAIAAYIGVDKFKLFYKGLNYPQNDDFSQYILPFIQDELLFFITDPISNDLQGDKFVAFRCPDKQTANNLLTAYGKKFGELKEFTHQNFIIKQIASSQTLQPIFGDIINPLQNPFYTTVDNFVIFANSSAALQNWIEKYNFNHTLSNNPQFAPAIGLMQQQANFSLFINPSYSLSIAKICSRGEIHSFLDEQFLNLYPFNPLIINAKGNSGSFACILTAYFNPNAKPAFDQTQPNGADSSLTIPKDSLKGKNNQSVSFGGSFVLWRTELKHPVKKSPQLINFPREGKSYLLAQDTARNLYFFDQSGNQLWTKQFETQPLGQVYPYDFFANGDIKLILSTERFIYILNKDGSVFKQIQLIANAIAGVLVLDYNKNGLILVGCADGNLYGYDKNGRPLTGWNPKKAAGKLVAAPQIIYDNNLPHIVVQNKANKIIIYNPDGKQIGAQVGVEAPQGYFQTDQNAQRIAIGTSAGKVIAINNQSKSFALAAVDKLTKSPQFVYANVAGDVRKDYLRYSGGLLQGHLYDEKNKFVPFLTATLGEKPAEVFEIVSPVSVFSQIGGLNKSLQQIYLYDNKAQLRAGFPLSGTTRFVLADFLGDKSETLIVGLQNAIVAYKLPSAR